MDEPLPVSTPAVHTSARTPHKPITAVWPGNPYPRGATWDGEGVNLSLFSANAEKVELCVFDPHGRRELQRIELKERTDDSWHAYLPKPAGPAHGYRVQAVRAGTRPPVQSAQAADQAYAKHIQGQIRWSDAHSAIAWAIRRTTFRSTSVIARPECRSAV
jgi:glycogen operon protein